MSHTPGPWRLGRRTKYRVRLSSATWSEFAKVVVRMDDADEDCATGLANARLMAAAPELLAAAKAYMAACPADPDITPQWQAAGDALIAAIAKAEGA